MRWVSLWSLVSGPGTRTASDWADAPVRVLSFEALRADWDGPSAMPVPK